MAAQPSSGSAQSSSTQQASVPTQPGPPETRPRPTEAQQGPVEAEATPEVSGPLAGDPLSLGLPSFIIGSVALGMVLVGFVSPLGAGASLPIILAATAAGLLISTLWAMGLGGLVAGLAVAHCGAGEAGSGACLIKFGTVAAGADSADRFDQLLAACEELAGEHGADRIVAGTSTARHHAYRRLMDLGYRTQFHGVRMQRPDDPGYCRREVWAIDDLR